VRSSLTKAHYYTKIDLRSVYHLVYIAKGDEWKTAFRTHYGSFEWLVMSFGLLNALSAFQRFINEIFTEMLDVSVVIYLDDILVYSDDLESHKRHVREVLRQLWDNGLYVLPTKCIFHQWKVEFLGFILSLEGIQMDTRKVQTIQDWPTPWWVKDVQAFVSFMNFYRWFIKGYSELVLPLTQLTWKNEPWSWTTLCQSSFKTLKQAFMSAPILVHWDPVL